jgi:hypothetical protein
MIGLTIAADAKRKHTDNRKRNPPQTTEHTTTIRTEKSKAWHTETALSSTSRSIAITALLIAPTILLG